MLNNSRFHKVLTYKVTTSDNTGSVYFKGRGIQLLIDELSRLQSKPSYKRVDEDDVITIDYIEPTYYKDLNWVNSRVNIAIKSIKEIDDGGIFQQKFLSTRRYSDDTELESTLRELYLDMAPKKYVEEHKTIIIEKTYSLEPIIEL